MESLVAFMSILLVMVVAGFLIASHISLRREIDTHEVELGDLVLRSNAEFKRSRQADTMHSCSLKKGKQSDVKINTMLKDGLATVNTRSNDMNSHIVAMERKQKALDSKVNFSTGLSAKGTLNVTGATAKVCIDGICMTRGDISNFKAAIAQLQKPHATTSVAKNALADAQARAWMQEQAQSQARSNAANAEARARIQTQAAAQAQADAQALADAPALDRLSSDGTSTLHQGNCLRSNKGRFCMQSDGNLVMYNRDGVPKWASSTYRKGSGPYKLVMQSDGNLVVYGNGKPTWSSSTWRKGTPPYIIVMQSDNNVVLYDKNMTATWASGTNNA
jgi:hypothetical protein